MSFFSHHNLLCYDMILSFQKTREIRDNSCKYKKQLCLEMFVPRFIGIRIFIFFLFLVLKVWLIFPFFGIYSPKKSKISQNLFSP